MRPFKMAGDLNNTIFNFYYFKEMLTVILNECFFYRARTMCKMGKSERYIHQTCEKRT